MDMELKGTSGTRMGKGTIIREGKVEGQHHCDPPWYAGVRYGTVWECDCDRQWIFVETDESFGIWKRKWFRISDTS